MNTNPDIANKTLDKKAFTKTRSFLIANVDKILENISSRREAKKNSADDLFDFGGEAETVAVQSNWKNDFDELSILEILMMEKEILGLYVSGNPLGEYKKLENWVQEITGYDDIYIIIVEKIRKIFTKVGNKMMLSIELSTTMDKVFDGVVYSKMAMEVSQVIQEKQIFFAKARIEEPKSKKKEEVAESDIEGETQIEEVKEFVENTKFVIEMVSPFEAGVLPLIEKLNLPLSANRIETLSQIHWEELRKNPTQIVSKDPSLVSEIKANLLKTIPQGKESEVFKINLFIQHGVTYKKIATELWLYKEFYKRIQSRV
jgi:DNA polymerase III alpha subunit